MFVIKGYILLCFVLNSIYVRGFSTNIQKEHVRSLPKLPTRHPETLRGKQSKTYNYDPVFSTSIASSNGHVEAQIREINNNLYVDSFKPEIISVKESMFNFAKYVIHYAKRNRIKAKLTKKYKKQMLSKKKTKDIAVSTDPFILQLQSEVEKEQGEKKSIIETFKALNQSRRNLIKLVEYDGKIFGPSFGALILAAFMSSVTPHYYSTCISYLSHATTTTNVQMIKALTGLFVVEFLTSFFSGVRGSLFWMAGMYTFK